jgi:hypothetical protein
VKGPNLKWLVSRAIFLARWRGRLHPSQCIRRIRPNCHADGQPWSGKHSTNQLAANRPGNRPRPHDRSGCRPRCPSQPRSRRRRPTPGPAAVSMQRGEHRGGGHTASIRRTEKRAGAAPDEHHLAVEGHTQSLRPERADCPLFIGRAPEPDQTIDLKARPHLTIGSRNRSGLLRRKTTVLRALVGAQALTGSWLRRR